MPRHITPRSTLAQLKRDAKRWLKALRENAADARARLARVFPDAPELPTLRDVQHALGSPMARRYDGTSGWLTRS
jgi:uncharacterized protein